MYAIVETGGKQVQVEVGQAIYVEKLTAEVGSSVTLDKVLFIGDKELKVGNPYVAGASVVGASVVGVSVVGISVVVVTSFPPQETIKGISISTTNKMDINFFIFFPPLRNKYCSMILSLTTIQLDSIILHSICQ